MQFPLTVDKLMPYLPHRAPMIWIDQVNQVTATSGEAQLTLKSNALYFDSHGLIHTAPIEWIAQAAGYCSAARALLANASPHLDKTFLVGIRDAEFGDYKSLVPGSTVTIQVEIVRELMPLVLIRGRVMNGSEEICRMILKLFGAGSEYNSPF